MKKFASVFPHRRLFSSRSVSFHTNSVKLQATEVATATTSTKLWEKVDDAVVKQTTEEFSKLDYESKVQRLAEITLEGVKEKFAEEKNKQLEYLNNLPLKYPQTLSAMKKIAADVAKNIDKFKKLNEIPNSFETIYAKYRKTIFLLEDSYKKIIIEDGIIDAADYARDTLIDFKFIAGQYSRREQEMEAIIKQMLASVVDAVYGIKLNPTLVDARALAIMTIARKNADGDLEVELLSRLYDSPDLLKNPMPAIQMNEEIMGPLIFRRELEALKQEEETDVEIRKYVKSLQYEDEKLLKIVQHAVDRRKRREEIAKRKEAGEQVEEPKEEPYELEEEEKQFEVEKRELATVEGWVNYKYQCLEALYRSQKMKVK